MFHRAIQVVRYEDTSARCTDKHLSFSGARYQRILWIILRVISYLGLHPRDDCSNLLTLLFQWLHRGLCRLKFMQLWRCRHTLGDEWSLDWLEYKTTQGNGTVDVVTAANAPQWLIAWCWNMARLYTLRSDALWPVNLAPRLFIS